MTLLDERPAGGASTLYPHRHGHPGGSLKQFYLRGLHLEPERGIEILVEAFDGSLRKTWLAELATQRLNELMRLQPGWDGYRARPITDEAVRAAVTIVFAVVDDISLPPQFFPLVDGGLQLEWHGGGIDIEIEVDADGTAHAFARGGAGATLVDTELTPQDAAVLRQVSAAVRRLSTRLVSAR